MSNFVPHRHQPDLFVADLTAVPLKELAEHLEYPFFGLAPQPHHGIRRFEDGHGNYIELHPGIRGLPTLFDQDILIYCMSVAMAEARSGRPVPKVVRMSAGELLRFTNRPAGGRQYAAVEDGIYRLTTLTLKTNLRGEEAVYNRLFGIVDEASMVRHHNRRDRPGALLGCEIVLSKWIREALEAQRVLTLHGDYFRLRSPLDRAVYQVVRKHCGEQREWTIGIPKLQNKIGSRNSLRNLRGNLRKLSARWADQDLLGYRIGFDGDRLVTGYVGESRRIRADLQPHERRLTPQTLATLRREHPDLDPGRMETLWRSWATGKTEPTRNAQAAFLGFCRRYVELRAKGDRQDREGPRPALGDAVRPEALAWWQGLTPERQRLAIEEFQICGKGQQWAFARTDKMLIERAACDWGGIAKPRGSRASP